ncbi:hypothetical protein ACOSP7_020826 [Xanthoceras sorbifolium]|uniref:Uncharacterized protein n=1 Tax=Xanthoceras sorbifolium TaxID=99658 RepID=A0ABQ8HL17_9ROSI|nr:hypothetical protein JRO89_XS09G0124300 [Xanthoceras sorbifolium]
MGKKRLSSRRAGVSKRKKDIREYQEESNIVENETWQETGPVDSSEKERELGKKKEVDGAGISDGVVVHDKLSEEMKVTKKELEEKINAGFKAIREEIDAGFKALREEMAARKEQQKDSIPKSSKTVARFASIPIQARTPEIEAILKEVTKSTSSEENNSETKSSPSSEEISSSSSEKNKKEADSSDEAEDVIIVTPRSFRATKKKGPAPTRRSSRIAGR